MIRCCQLLVGLRIAEVAMCDPPVGAVTGVRLRSATQHVFEVKSSFSSGYAAGRTRTPRIGS